MLGRSQTRRVLAVAFVCIAAACSTGSVDSAGSGDEQSADTTVAATNDEGTTAAETGDTAAPDTEPEVQDDEQGDDQTGDQDADQNSDDEVAEARYLTGDSDFLFDQNTVHTFQIELSDDALAELDNDPAAEEYVEGSLTFDGETIGPIGVRYKGSIGAFIGCTAGSNPFVPEGEKTCTKLSLKLKINWDGADQEFYGQRRVQLHSMNLDTSMMHDRLGYYLFREMGVAAPRSTHARVEVNGEFVGVFALVEQIDGRFTRDRFDDGTGNLYKEVWPINDQNELTPTDTLIDGLETNEDDSPTADLLQAFARDVLESDAPFDADVAREVLGRWVDLDELVTYAVVDRAIRNDDGLFHWYCIGGACEPHNFFVYEDPTAERIHVIPWDLDNSFSNLGTRAGGVGGLTFIPDDFGDITDDCAPFSSGPFPVQQRSAACDPIIGAWAQLDDEFAAIDAAFRAGPYDIDNVRALIEEWSEQIAPLVEEAAEIYDDAPSVDQWNRALETLLADIENPAEAS